jgi:RsiW-degrading membrane proteinase PrsW (M82 family)
MNQYAFGLLFGGVIISLLGALSTYTVEKKKPTMKSVIRDFIIGSVLFLLIMQLLPESSESLISYILSFVALPVVSSYDDMEIQVGVPQF